MIPRFCRAVYACRLIFSLESRSFSSSTSSAFSSASSTWRRTTVDEDEPAGSTQRQLPRYVRRQALNKPTEHTERPDGEDSPADQSKRASQMLYRSRHLDPSQPPPDKSNVKLLEPYVLASRLKRLCDKDKLDEAVSTLKKMPLDAQNTPVWNTVIWECMKAGRYKLGYQLYIDMKRRGFSPTTRTFRTMLSGLSRIEQWAHYPKQLNNARSLYDAYLRHIASIKKQDPESPELSVQPLAAYIKILGDAGQYQEMFDVYYSLDTNGRLAPDHNIFGAMFQVMASFRNALSDSKIGSDAKLLWNQMQSLARKKPDFKVDPYVLSSAISALSRGGPAEHDLAFAIVREYFGLSESGDSPAPGKYALSAESFSAVLSLCNRTKRYSLVDYFFQQVKRRPESEGGPSILDRAHLEEIFKAYLNLPNSESDSAPYALRTLEWMLRQEIIGSNGPKIRPSLTTYGYVFRACWRAADWDSATRTFELMTGYQADDFADGIVVAEPQMDKRTSGRNLLPDVHIISLMLQTALTSRSPKVINQCLRIVDHCGVEDQLSSPKQTKRKASKAERKIEFFRAKLAASLLDAVKRVSQDSRSAVSGSELDRWRLLASQAQKIVQSNDASAPVPDSHDLT